MNHVEEMAELFITKIIGKLAIPDCENTKANTYSLRPKMIDRVVVSMTLQIETTLKPTEVTVSKDFLMMKVWCKGI
jgi:hypothetical protein